MEAGLELLKALTDRGSGRLKNLDARLEKLDGQIREQAAYLEKVRQNGKRRKELEERKRRENSSFRYSRQRPGAWEEAKSSGDAVPELDRMIQECTEWERQYGGLEQDQSRLAGLDRRREEEAGGLERLLKRQAELDQELLAEKREIRSLSEADGERERLLGRQTGLQNRRNGPGGEIFPVEGGPGAACREPGAAFKAFGAGGRRAGKKGCPGAEPSGNGGSRDQGAGHGP